MSPSKRTARFMHSMFSAPIARSSSARTSSSPIMVLATILNFSLAEFWTGTALPFCFWMIMEVGMFVIVMLFR